MGLHQSTSRSQWLDLLHLRMGLEKPMKKFKQIWWPWCFNSWCFFGKVTTNYSLLTCLNQQASTLPTSCNCPTIFSGFVLLGQRTIQLIHENLEFGTGTQTFRTTVQDFRCNQQRCQVGAFGLVEPEDLSGHVGDLGYPRIYTPEN